MSLYAGIDVGGTTIKSSLVDADNQMALGPTLPTGTDAVGQLKTLAITLKEENPGLAGIGVVTPGIVDEHEGRVTFSSNLDLGGVRLAQMVEEATGIPTLLGHDGRAAGLAEAQLGAGKGARSFVMVPIGTGISAALYLNGAIRAGSTFCAGEIGHSPIFPGGELCSCGQRGCLEAYASASAIGRRYRERTGETIGARGVEERLGSDPVADQVWGDAVEALAIGFTQLTLSLDPEMIIVGGGLSGAGETLLGPIRRRMGDLLTWRPVPRLDTAILGDQAGRWGAAMLGMRAAKKEAES